MVFKNYYKILDLETSYVSIDEIKQHIDWLQKNTIQT